MYKFEKDFKEKFEKDCIEKHPIKFDKHSILNTKKNYEKILRTLTDMSYFITYIFFLFFLIRKICKKNAVFLKGKSIFLYR